MERELSDIRQAKKKHQDAELERARLVEELEAARSGLDKLKRQVSTAKPSSQDLRYMTAVAERAVEAIAIIDLKGKVKFANRAWADLHGYASTQELLGKKIGEFYGREVMRDDIEPWIERSASRDCGGQTEQMRQDGRATRSHLRISAIRDGKGKVVGHTFFALDQSDSGQFESQLRRRDEQIEALNAELRSVEETRSELRRELDGCRASLDHESRKLEAATEQLERQGERCANAEEEVRSLRRELGDGKIRLERELESLRSSSDQWNAELTSVKRDLQSENSRRIRAEEQVEQLREELREVREDLTQCRSEASRYERELSDCRREVEKFAAEAKGQKGLGQSFKNLTTVAEQAIEGIVVVDSKGTLKFVNDAWAQMHGYSNRKELTGASLGKFFSDEQMRSSVSECLEQAQKMGCSTRSTESLRVGMPAFASEIRAVRITDDRGKVSGFAVYSRDVDALRRSEQKLAAVQEATRELEREKQDRERLEREVERYMLEIRSKNE